MGIYDRDYYQGDGRSGLGGLSGWSANTWLIVANIAVFVLMIFSPAVDQLFGSQGHFSTWHVLLHDNPNGTKGGLEFWRFLTFQFLHAGPLHLAMNMFGLYIFGQRVEEHLGRRKYLAFYLVCGIFGGLMYLLLNLGGLLLPNMPFLLFSDPRTPLVGASAGVFGVILACAYISPDMQVQLLLPPVVMRIKTMAYVYVAIALLTILFRGSNAGGEAAHLGGALAGAFFVRNSHLLRDFFDVFKDSRKVGQTGKPRRGFPRREAASKAGPSAREEAEVDRILAKVKESGVQSLTEGEKRTLARDTENKRSGR